MKRCRACTEEFSALPGNRAGFESIPVYKNNMPLIATEPPEITNPYAWYYVPKLLNSLFPAALQLEPPAIKLGVSFQKEGSPPATAGFSEEGSL